MPTLPLHETPADANAWHRVRSPGGYEFWRFAAHDQETAIHVVAIFSLGGLFRDDYVKQAARYARRPTRTLPPIPSDYPAILARISGDGGQTTSRVALPAADFHASTQPLVIRFGTRSLQWDERRACLVEFSDDQIQLRLTFAPRASLLDELSATNAHDRSSPASPCGVTGSVRCAGRDIAFSGSGTYEHCYGTRPIDCSDRLYRVIQTDVGKPWANRI